LASSGLDCLFLGFLNWKAFKTLRSERRFQVAGGADFQEEDSKLYAKLLKVFLHPSPPFWKEKVFLGLFEQAYQK
jgi:hypothetical protein